MTGELAIIQTVDFCTPIVDDPFTFGQIAAAVARLVEFESLHSILKDWCEQILNHFDCRITNGFVEGKNNRIKTFRRMAHGYRNMEDFRLRILAANRTVRSVSPLLT